MTSTHQGQAADLQGGRIRVSRRPRRPQAVLLAQDALPVLKSDRLHVALLAGQAIGSCLLAGAQLAQAVCPPPVQGLALRLQSVAVTRALL